MWLHRLAVAFLAAFACALGGCATGGPDDVGCPTDSLLKRYELVGSPRLCGGCDPDCHLTTDRPDQGDLDSDDRVWPASTGFDPALDGIKIVPPGVRVTSLYAWLANTSISTVTKVHLKNHTADGVYRVGIQSVGVGNYPSRTTVDILGCAYVAQRAFDAQGSVTKIAGEEADCMDANGNGVIDTSHGLNDIRGWPGTVSQDECVLWNVPVGAPGGTPRAMAIDALGRVWVGLFTQQRFIVLSSINGDVVGSVPVSVTPYGAAITPDGTLWATGITAIQPINTLTPIPSGGDAGSAIATPTNVYGIAVDQNNRVFVSNWSSGGMHRYTPGVGWISGGNGGAGTTSGVSVEESGVVFGSDIWNSHVTMYDAETLNVIGGWNVGASGGVWPHGVCPDFFGMAWTGNMGSANVSVIDPGGAVIATIPVQAANYTYSDFTGYGLMTFAALVGYVFRDYDSHDACAGASIRERVYYEVSFDSPGVINFHGRSADSEAGLETADEDWLGTADGSTAPGLMHGSVPIRGPMSEADASRQYFRLRIELLRAGPESPVLHEYTIEEYCL